MTYKRISNYWHRLDIEIDGRRCTFFGFSKRDVFERAEQHIRSPQDFRRLVAIEESSNVIDFTVARGRA